MVGSGVLPVVGRRAALALLDPAVAASADEVRLLPRE
jgi:hypothetical protein